ncbi:hypothetical protein CMK11_04290 [Candidatus Poribacteria bacterium]|nr:hypothetical protein [Candidatus Poribacteria bacterium]
MPALARRGRAGDDIHEDVRAAIQEFEEDFNRRWRVTQITPEVRVEAMSLGIKHFLRGDDAVHLTSATLAARRRRHPGVSELILVSADSQLNVAAESEGLAVLNPAAAVP